jgi:hemerythrin
LELLKKEKIEAEINKVEVKRTIQRITEMKSWLFEKINKIDKPLVKLTKRKRENIQINKIRDKKRTSQQIAMKFRVLLGMH